MSTYCTIQEAYNEPSFSKQKKPTSGKMQCGQSNTPYANNVYSNQVGQEQASYRPAIQSQNNPQSVQQRYMSAQKRTPPLVANTPGTQGSTDSQGMVNLPDVHKGINSPNMVEEFICGGSAAVIPTNSSGKMSKQIDPVIGNIPYAAQANDYKYYCDNMGICPSPKISIEGFTDNYGSESYLEPPGYNTPNQKDIQGLQHALQYQDGLPQNGLPQRQSQSQPSNCQMSDQATTYQYPISELSKKQYDSAMKVYLNNGQCSTPQKQSPYSMNNVNGLYDEEIGQYMRVQDIDIPYTIPPSSTYDNSFLMSQQMQRNKNNFTPMPSDDYHSLSSTSEQVQNNSQINNNSPNNMPSRSPAPSNSPNNYVGGRSPAHSKSPAPSNSPNNYVGGRSPSPQVNTSNIDLTNLNQYLANINEYLANINQYLPGSNIYNAANTSNITTQNTQTSQIPQTPQTTSNTQPNKWNYIMDTVLFVAAGILIIILCDLLFKIAYSIGMRDTFRMMKPYLTEIDELKAKIAELVPDDD